MTQICTGCGTTKSIEEIREEHPRALSCCPEREMMPIKDMWEEWCASLPNIKYQTTFMLRSGVYFDLLNPDGCKLRPSDMVLGTSRECRYGAQCEPYYSVAEHQVHLSIWIEDMTGDAGLAWAALWHDAIEGLIHDIMRPMKQLLPDYKRLEDRIERSILPRLGIALPLPELVKKYDLQAQLVEKAQIEPHRSNGEPNPWTWPRPFKVMGYSEERARDFFWARVWKLRPDFQDDWLMPIEAAA